VSASGFLETAQRRLWRLITAPEGVRTALAEEAGEEPLAALVRSDALLCAEDRLDVYANAYFYRILEVLQDDYPTLAAALGDADFHDLATSYLAVHPSEHPSLRFIGASLERFLRHSAAAASTRERAPWAADLAAFEWAKGEVFDARNAQAGARADLAGVAPEAFETLQLACVPAVRLLELAWPVDVLDAEAAELAAETARLAAEPTRLCVWRRDERTYHRRVDALEAEALARAEAGVRFGALCALASDRCGDAEAPALAAGWLARWLDDALLHSPADRERDPTRDRAAR